MSTKKEQFWTVTARDRDTSLQEFLARQMGVSKRVAKQQIDARVVWVNDRCVWMAHHALRKDDIVRLTRTVASPTARSNVPDRIKVLFEDEWFLGIDKPSGMLSNAADTSAESIARRMTGIYTLQAVHRLDRDTTGCLLLAKTQAAMDASIRVFREHHVAKTYRALVFGRWDASSSTLDLPIAEERALTHVTCVRATDVASQLIVRIETGRTHQIRRHLAMARHPILGDRQYGPKEVLDADLQLVARPMLHSVEMAMDHPMREGRALKFFAPLPQDYIRWAKKLRIL